ncbi:MAG: 50S ribosomal protein L4 [Alphaproteobacteria bacterium]|nr:50S ribosomal protein L4 [Alphaproteobacteria bacterium]MBL0718166.1 50S ribosomal protein L4 [Alphaproteobacteria bacterium]
MNKSIIKNSTDKTTAVVDTKKVVKKLDKKMKKNDSLIDIEMPKSIKVDVVDFNNKKLKDLTLDPSIFLVEPRKDIMHRVITWQRSRTQAGTHSTKQISEVSGGGRKPFKQKGTGRARQGSSRSSIQRGGMITFGPTPRSHATKLNKKIRSLGLKMGLSQHTVNKNIVVIDKFPTIEKTNEFDKKFAVFNKKSVLFVDVDKNEKFARVIANLPNLNIIPVCGLNLYDLLKHKNIFFTENSINAIIKRLGD